jgi:hypothetical protein
MLPSRVEIGQPVAKMTDRGSGGLAVPQAPRGGRLQGRNAPVWGIAATSFARCKPAEPAAARV